jgi:environmental stress-induced protein Ves
MIRYAELPVIPWKNGAGTRRDLVSGVIASLDGEQDTGGTWMIGLADLHQDAPFSFYPGVSRWFLPIGKGRLTLIFNNAGVEQAVALHGSSQAHPFAGSDVVAMQLHDGPMKALNVMTTGWAPEVKMQRVRVPESSRSVLARSDESSTGPAAEAGAGMPQEVNLLLVTMGRCRVMSAGHCAELSLLDSCVFSPEAEVFLDADTSRTCEIVKVSLRWQS